MGVWERFMLLRESATGKFLDHFVYIHKNMYNGVPDSNLSASPETTYLQHGIGAV
jgi:hypothetical protein